MAPTTTRVPTPIWELPIWEGENKPALNLHYAAALAVSLTWIKGLTLSRQQPINAAVSQAINLALRDFQVVG
jgi:hypothetical protein